MATVTVTFTFDTTAQGFAQNPGTSVSMDGTGGSLVSSRAVKGNTGADSSWTRTLTYITMGVPAGAIVRSITSASMDSRCTAFTSAGAGNTSGAVTLQDGASIATLSAQRSITATDGAPVTTAGVDLTGLSNAASNSVVITIPNHLQNANTTGSTVTLSQDTLTFILTYDFPYFDGIDQRPQPPALRESINRAAATMAGDPGHQAQLGQRLYQDTQLWPQPPASMQRFRRAGGIMPVEPGNELPFVYVAPAPPVRFTFDQPAQLPIRRNRYTPTRLSLGLPIFPGSVSWEAAAPDLPRRRLAYGYTPTRLSVTTGPPPAGAPLVDWVPPLPDQTARRRVTYGYQPTRLSVTSSTAPAAPLTTMWGEQIIASRKGRITYEALGQKLAVPLFPLFVPLTWERDHNFVRPRKINNSAIDPGQVPYPPLVPTQAGVLVGFEPNLTPPRIRPHNRGAAIRDVAINQYPAPWVNYGFEPALPLTARPKRNPIEPTQYGPLGGRVQLEWGFQPTEAWPPIMLARRHPHAELPRLDTLLLNLTSPPYSWQPLCELLEVRTPVYRGAALHHDFNIEAEFKERRLAGWEIAPPIIPHPRYKLSDYAYPGGLRVPGAIAMEWGFEQTQAAPLLNPLGRHRHAEPVWRVDPLPLVPTETLVSSAWEPVLPLLKVTGMASRAAGFQQQLPIEGEFFPRVRFGWQPELPDLLFRRHTSQAAGGDPTAELFPPTLHAWGFEPQYATPLRPIGFRSRYAELTWRIADPISAHPTIDLNWGFEAIPANPLRNFWNRSGALTGPGNIETRFERGFPFGWFVQPWQPPQRNRYRQAAIFAGHPGIDARFNRFFPFGWPIQPWQPPATRQNRAAALLPGWFGDVAKYVPPAPAALISWVPDNQHQTLLPRGLGNKHIIATLGGEVSGIFSPSPATRTPQSGFIVNLGRFMSRGTR